MKRFKKRRFSYNVLPWYQVFLISFFIFLFVTFIGVGLVNKEIRPTLRKYAKSQTTTIATLVINDAIKKTITVYDLDNILINKGATNNNLEFDSNKVNQILSELTRSIQMNLQDVEEGKISDLKQLTKLDLKTNKKEGVIFYVPIGLVTDNAFLAHLGPSIPIKFCLIGEVETDIVPKITPYGINSAYVEVIVEAKVHISIIIPFSTEVTTITTHIPIAMGMIQGEVPGFYNGLFPGASQK